MRIKRYPEVTLDHILENPEAKFHFYQYTKNEFSGEYNMCLEEISAYKMQPNFDEKMMMAQRIMDLYLNGYASELEIATKRSTRQALVTAFRANSFDNKLFDSVEMEILRHMQDVLKRFKLTFRFRKVLSQFIVSNVVSTRSEVPGTEIMSAE